jgi:hypothetical protein
MDISCVVVVICILYSVLYVVWCVLCDLQGPLVPLRGGAYSAFRKQSSKSGALLRRLCHKKGVVVLDECEILNVTKD